jgi:dihydrofolate synthase/folylpolyglutamate synthase
MAAIARFIRDRLAPPRVLVFGIMRDKEIEPVADILFPLFESVIATEPYPPRSAPAADLAALARSRGIEAYAEAQPQRAIERALRSGQRTIFIGGSLYLAGAAVQYFDAQREERAEKEQRG